MQRAMEILLDCNFALCIANIFRSHVEIQGSRPRFVRGDGKVREMDRFLLFAMLVLLLHIWLVRTFKPFDWERWRRLELQEVLEGYEREQQPRGGQHHHPHLHRRASGSGSSSSSSSSSSSTMNTSELARWEEAKVKLDRDLAPLTKACKKAKVEQMPLQKLQRPVLPEWLVSSCLAAVREDKQQLCVLLSKEGNDDEVGQYMWVNGLHPSDYGIDMPSAVARIQHLVAPASAMLRGSTSAMLGW